MFAAGVALLTLLAAAYWFRNPPGSGDFSRMTVRPLASQPGLEDNPSISPDGLWISCLYRVQASDRPKLQVHSLQGGPPLEIETADWWCRGRRHGRPIPVSWLLQALEGSRVHAIYRVSRTGGVPRRIAECKSQKQEPCELDWSPDGTTLAVADRRPDNSELYLVDLANGGRRELITPVKESVTRPRFSPDGKWSPIQRQVSLTSDDFYVVAAAGGKPRRVTRNPWLQKGFAWSKDGKRLVAISSRLSQQA